MQTVAITNCWLTTWYTHVSIEFDKFEVKHHQLSLFEWKEASDGDVKGVKIYNKAAAHWKLVAERLGFDPEQIKVIQRSNFMDDHDCVTAVFREWFANAVKLPNHKKYPKKWSGLVRLLDDSDMGELAKDLQRALSAPFNSARDNMWE